MISTRAQQLNRIQVPSMGDSISDGQLGKWLKQPGEFAKTDEIVVTIETDKTAQYVAPRPR